MNQENKNLLFKLWKIFILVWALDFLVLTPIGLTYFGAIEMNPIHSLGCSLLGNSYFYATYVPWTLLVLLITFFIFNNLYKKCSDSKIKKGIKWLYGFIICLASLCIILNAAQIGYVLYILKGGI